MAGNVRAALTIWQRWVLVLILGGVGIATILATSPPCGPMEPCPIERLELEPGSMTLQVGDKAQIAVSVIDTQGNVVSPKLVAGYDFDWGSSDSLVATVDSTGVVTAVDLGSTSIFVHGVSFAVRGLSAEALVAVVKSP